MSIAQTVSSPKRVERRRFRPADMRAEKVSLPDLRLEQAVLAEILPNSTLEALAEQTGAQDQRKRKLTCVVFFWLMVLAAGPGGALNLAGLISTFVVSYVLVTQGQMAMTLSKQAVSENLQVRPWQFFEAVLKHLVTAYSLLAGTVAPVLNFELLEHLMLIDASTLRLAECLIQAFPGHRTGLKAEWAAAKVHMALHLFQRVPRVLALTAEKVNEKTVDFLLAVGEKALYVIDLGYWKYSLFDDIIDRLQHFVSRLRDDCNPLIKEVYVGSQAWVGRRYKEIALSGQEVDLRVNLTAATSRQTKMRHDVRLVGQVCDGVWHLYVTSIFDRGTYTASVIVQIYALRWQIEIFFRDLKCVLHIENFIARNENGIRIQIYAALIFYVLTHLVMLKAAQRTQTAVEHISVPRCLTAVAQVLSRINELPIKDHHLDWPTLEERLVDAVALLYRRPKRKHPSRLAQATEQLSTPTPITIPIPASCPALC